MRALLVLLLVGCGATPAPPVPAWQIELDALREAHFVAGDLDEAGRWRLVELLEQRGESAQAEVVSATLPGPDAAADQAYRAWLRGGATEPPSAVARRLAEQVSAARTTPRWRWLRVAAGAGEAVPAARGWVRAEPASQAARVALAMALVAAPMASDQRYGEVAATLEPVLVAEPEHAAARLALARAAWDAGLRGVALDALARAHATPAVRATWDALPAPTDAPTAPPEPLGEWTWSPPADWARSFADWVAPGDLLRAFQADTIVLFRGRRSGGAGWIDSEVRLARTPSAWRAAQADPGLHPVGRVDAGWLFAATRSVSVDTPFYFADPRAPVYAAVAIVPRESALLPFDGAPSAEVVEADLHYLSTPRPPLPTAPFGAPFSQLAPRLALTEGAPPAPRAWSVLAELSVVDGALAGTVRVEGPRPPGEWLAAIAAGPWAAAGDGFARPVRAPLMRHEGHAVAELLAGVEVPGWSLARLLDAAQAPDRSRRLRVPPISVDLTVRITLPTGWRPALTWDSFDLQGNVGAAGQSLRFDGSVLELRRETRLMARLADPGTDTPFTQLATDIIARTSGVYRFVAPAEGP